MRLAQQKWMGEIMVGEAETSSADRAAGALYGEPLDILKQALAESDDTV